MRRALVPLLVFSLFTPLTVLAQGACVITTTPASDQKRIFLTCGTSWVVPDDWNSANNTIEVVGGGAGGSAYAGGGGGAYAKIANLTLTARAYIAYQVGAGGKGVLPSGSGNASGSDTYFMNISTVLAKGGAAATTYPNGGAGGSTSGSVGSVKYAGGNGGTVGRLYGSAAGSGGGGAGGPNGQGAAGGSGVAGVGPTSSGGMGGGGSGGGSAGENYTSGSATRGGASFTFQGGGAAGSGSAGGAGTLGGGGGGGAGAIRATAYRGGNGGSGDEWTIAGSGGGGGGGGMSSDTTNTYYSGGGGTGGNYGGGGGGGATLPVASINGKYGTPGDGGSGIIVITYKPLPTCTITIDPATVDAPGSSRLTWTSENATTFYISNVGYVLSSGSTSVAPSQTTVFSGTVTGQNGTASCGATLTVNRACSFNGQTVPHGSSVIGYQSASVPYGSSCLSESRSCINGTLFGTYAYASCAPEPPAACLLDGASVAHGSARDFYFVREAERGALCSSYAQSRSCNNGALSGSEGYQYASCACTASSVYSCTGIGGNTIRRTDISSSCQVATSDGPTCTSPAFCSQGSAICLYPQPLFVANGSRTGHLELVPNLVALKGRVRVHWNVENVSSCIVRGSNSDFWTGNSSGAAGAQTSIIGGPTTFTLSCTGLDGSTLEEHDSLTILPRFEEK